MASDSPEAALDRPRLYEQLDRIAAGSTAWLAAAGGYGKTTLVLAYARTHRLPLLSVNVPEWGMTAGDFLFAVRTEAIRLQGLPAESLPLLEPASSGIPAPFAASFGETLSRALGTPCLLLVDNLHRIQSDDPLHEVIQRLVGGSAGRLRLVVASRHEPAPFWARLRGQSKLHVFDEADLSFREDELATLLTTRTMPEPAVADPPTAAERLLRLTGGWPAGVMLLLEHWRRTGALEPERRLASSCDSLADWFRAEVYQELHEADRDLLCEVALPTSVPRPSLELASDVDQPAERLDRLCRRHAFIRRTHDPDGTDGFALHDLFRAFLLEEGQRRWSPDDMAGRRARWAHILWDHGDWNTGAELFLAAGDHATFAARLRQAAQVLISTGRGETLSGWLESLPASVRRSDPELRMWEGMCLLLRDTRQAREILGEAWEMLESRGALIPMAITWTGIIDSIWLEWAHVSEYDPWIDAFHRYEPAFRAELPVPLWFAVLRGILSATCHARPLDPGLGALEREALGALEGEMPASERLMLAGQLIYLNTWQFGRRAGASRVMALMADHQDAVDRASPLARCLWKTFTAAWSFLYEGDKSGCLEEAREGRTLIRRNGISTWDCAVPPLHCAVAFDDRDAFADWQQWFMRSECKANRAFYETFRAHFMACEAWLQGNTHEAVQHGRQSLLAAERHGSLVISAGFRALLAGCLAEAGEYRDALREAARSRHLGQDFPSDFLTVMLFLPLARIPFRRGQMHRARPYIRRAFEAGARQRLFFPLMIPPRELAGFCALALAEGIAPDYARWVIRTAALAPPKEPVLRQSWPWSVRLRVLGTFHLETDGVTSAESKRRRQKGEALLSELVLAGPGGVEQETLAERIWPDSPPNKALNSLYVALHRQREQLGYPDALEVRDGRVTLNKNRVWVDLWEFRRLTASSRPLDQAALRYGVQCYEGELKLPGIDEMQLELERAAVLGVYEKLALQLGWLLEHDKPEEAAQIYRQALIHCGIRDELCAGIMRCEASTGGPRALKRTFEKVRDLYHRELEIAPPAHITSLYKSLQSG